MGEYECTYNSSTPREQHPHKLNIQKLPTNSICSYLIIGDVRLGHGDVGAAGAGGAGAGSTSGIICIHHVLDILVAVGEFMDKVRVG